MSDSPAPKVQRGPFIGTHSGTFHCDEVLACFMLHQLPKYQDLKILRSRCDKTLRDECSIIVDVGGLFEHDNCYYDHHQKTFHETFSSLRPDLGDEFKIRLSSAGLIYVHYGEQVISAILERADIHLSPENLKLVFIQIYRNFISEIDAIDNGVPMYEGDVGKATYKISTHLSARIGKLNPSWEDERDENQSQDQYEMDRFKIAMKVAGQEFTENVLRLGSSWIKAREYVREALVNAKSVYASGEILVLPRFCPWKAHLFDLEKEYGVEGVAKLVIWEENNKTCRVAGVPETPDSFLGRQFLPLPWRGLRNAELDAAAGIKGLTFVHHNGFIGGANTIEAAMAMAKKSIEWANANGAVEA